jgi:hypothetical protein
MFMLSTGGAIVFGLVMFGLLLWRMQAVGMFLFIAVACFAWAWLHTVSPVSFAILLIVVSLAVLVATVRFAVSDEKPTRR